MSMVEGTEEPFEAALKQCGNIDAFLDSFFGFLSKRTDFFIQCPPEGGRYGFPPGHAEAMVRNKFKKWEQISKQGSTPFETPTTKKASIKNEELKMPVGIEKAKKNQERNSEPSASHQRQKNGGPDADTSNDVESYNGRTTEKYSWSQTITDVDVKVPVEPHVKKGKQVQVVIQSTKLCVVEVGKDGEPFIDGKLSFPVKKDESYWNLVPGECIRIWLQKGQERWWQALLEGEALLEMNKIESVRPMEELDEEEQMKIQELCWNEERKKLGLPTSEEMKMQKLLEQAWNAEGSPFKGTPVDPSMIQCLPQNQSSFIGPEGGT